MTSVSSVTNGVSTVVVGSAVSAGVGYLCAKAFTNLNPINGAVFGGIYGLVSGATYPIFKALFMGKEANAASQFIGGVLSIGASVAASIAISNALGYSVTAGAAVTLAVVPGIAIGAIAISAVAIGAIVCVGIALKAG